MKDRTLFIFGLAVTVLWLGRCVLAGTFQFYGFIPLNIVLAAVPLLLEPVFNMIRRHLHSWKAAVAQGFCGVVWLLFIPNAFYILTDFMHLNSNVLVNARGDNHHRAVHYIRGDGLFVFDSLVIFLAAVFGAYVGSLALLHCYRFLKHRVSFRPAATILAVVMLLSSVGVYIGRFGRWSSWEALYQPWVIASELYRQLLPSAARQRFVLVILSVFIFQVICFWLLQRTLSAERASQR